MVFSLFRKLPIGVTEERLIQILPLLAGFTEHQWTYPRIEDLEMIDKVLDLNKISVNDAIMQIGTVCSDFLLVCYFDRKKFPCFQVRDNYFSLTIFLNTFHLCRKISSSHLWTLIRI